MKAVIADRGALGRMASALGKNIDYAALAFVLGDIGVRHIFVSSKEPGVEQGVIIPQLEAAGWTVHPFDPMPGPDGRPRAYPEVDMALCAVLGLPDNVKAVTLCTGANAAAPIAKALREGGIHVRVASFRGSLGGELRRSASCLPNGEPDVVYLDALGVFLSGK